MSNKLHTLAVLPSLSYTTIPIIYLAFIRCHSPCQAGVFIMLPLPFWLNPVVLKPISHYACHMFKGIHLSIIFFLLIAADNLLFYTIHDHLYTYDRSLLTQFIALYLIITACKIDLCFNISVFCLYYRLGPLPVFPLYIQAVFN
jgi:hypothetical protein